MTDTYDGVALPRDKGSTAASLQPSPPVSSPSTAWSSPPDSEPPDSDKESSASSASSSTSPLSQGLRVLKASADALRQLTHFYETDPSARAAFTRAVDTIATQSLAGGRLVIIGVGKSGHVGTKLAATLVSLGVRAVCLHATDALHGDIGLVGPRDALLFITYSGRTPELLRLLPHLDKALPAILLTSHTRREDCEMARRMPDAVLLPAPLPEPESVSVGVSAPTVSTTVAMAVGDALAIAAAHELHEDAAKVFARNHPGGAIGMIDALP